MWAEYRLFVRAEYKLLFSEECNLFIRVEYKQIVRVEYKQSVNVIPVPVHLTISLPLSSVAPGQKKRENAELFLCQGLFSLSP